MKYFLNNGIHIRNNHKRTRRGQQNIAALDYSNVPDIIKNNEVVEGIFSSCYSGSTGIKHEEIFPLTAQNISIEKGLDFMLIHLQEPIWPRTIFTKTLARQYIVYSREEALARFKQS